MPLLGAASSVALDSSESCLLPKGRNAMPVSDDQLRAIGRITVSFNTLEFFVNVFLWGFATPQSPPLGKVIFEGESFDRVLARVKKLSAHILREDPPSVKRMRDWTGRVSDVQRRRNEVLHANWVLEGPTGEVVGTRSLRKNEPEVASTATELNRLADDIEAAIQESVIIFAHVFLRDTKPGEFMHELGVELRRLSPFS
jgi:hypothetical protein